MSPLLRGHWRELLVVLLIATPITMLIVAGTIAIVGSDWFLELFAVMGGCSLAAKLLVSHLCRSARQAVINPPKWPDGKSPLEAKAGEAVKAIALRVEASPPSDIDALRALAQEVIDTVATILHADAKFAWATFTMPEVLLALEHSSRRLRHAFERQVPGSQVVRVSHLLHLRDQYVRHEQKAHFARLIWRVIRMVKSPVTALVQELKDYTTGIASDGGKNWLHGQLLRTATDEFGRAAIELYAGRMRRTDEQAHAELVHAAPAPRGPVPVRVLIAGQTNAGKSSLVNALTGTIQAPVSGLPIAGEIQSYRFPGGDHLDLTFLDSPGMGHAAGDGKAWLKSIGKVDLIIWVTQAIQPARQIDVQALRALRDWYTANPQLAQPSVVIAVTHIDQLKPVREWNPPYDLAHPNGPKAEQIRDAVLKVADALAHEQEAIVPVSLAASEAPYNVDALWTAITQRLDGASQIALGRALKQSQALDPVRFANQVYEAGKSIFDSLHDRSPFGR